MRSFQELADIRRSGRRPGVPIVLIPDKRLEAAYEEQGFYVMDWRGLRQDSLFTRLCVTLAYTEDRAEEAQALAMRMVHVTPLHLSVVKRKKFQPYGLITHQSLITNSQPHAKWLEARASQVRQEFEQKFYSRVEALTKQHPEADLRVIRRFVWKHLSDDMQEALEWCE